MRKIVDLMKNSDRVTREQEEIYQHSFDESNFNSRLDSPITDKEVVGAVRRLKLGKAAGNDEIVAEILARGGPSS